MIAGRELDEHDLTRIAARACMGSRLEPIGRGNNIGAIWAYGSENVVVDCFGHEGNAEFLSNAQADVLTLVDEVRRLRAALAAHDAARGGEAAGVDASGCSKTGQPDVLPSDSTTDSGGGAL